MVDEVGQFGCFFCGASITAKTEIGGKISYTCTGCGKNVEVKAVGKNGGKKGGTKKAKKANVGGV